MKKIILAIAFFGFAFAQINAQNPAPVSTTKMDPTGVQTANPKMATPQKATPATPQAAVKPVAKSAPKVAPASVTQGKPVMHKQGAHGKTKKHVIKENKDAAKPMAPGDNNKK